MGFGGRTQTGNLLKTVYSVRVVGGETSYFIDMKEQN